MPSGDLCTLSDVKAFTQTSAVNANDGALSTLITAASGWIKTFTNRDFVLKMYSEIRDGTGSQEMFLRNGPAVSVSALTVNGRAISAQPVDQQAGYFLSDDSNILCLFGYEFCRGRKNVRLTYLGGSNVVPPDIAQACMELVASAWGRGKREGGALVEQSLGPEGAQSFRWSTADIPAPTKAVLVKYSRVVPV